MIARLMLAACLWVHSGHPLAPTPADGPGARLYKHAMARRLAGRITATRVPADWPTSAVLHLRGDGPPVVEIIWPSGPSHAQFVRRTDSAEVMDYLGDSVGLSTWWVKDFQL